MNRSGRPQRAVQVAVLPRAGGDLVEKAVAGAGVEGLHAAGVGAGQEGDVGDAPHVQDHAAVARLGEQRPVRERHQRRAHAPGRDIGGSEVGHHGLSGRLRENGGLPELQGGGTLPAACPVRAGVVLHRLPVRGDQVGVCGQGRGGLGVDLAQPPVQLGQVGGVRLAAHGREHGGAQVRRVRRELVRHDPATRRAARERRKGRARSQFRPAGKLQQRGVHAVGARAAHQAQHAGRPGHGVSPCNSITKS